MAVLKFRVYPEDDSSVYRDIVIKHTQNFLQFHESILAAFGFDNKHEATFYRSNDNWQRGKEISLKKYNKPYKAEPLLMAETLIGSEIRDTNQHFVYEYDFTKNWVFFLELINVSKIESSKITYPSVSRTEGIGPQQYGTKSILDNKFLDIEEKYDLSKNSEGFSEEGEKADEAANAEEDERTEEEI
ncbi:MAG: hypothetical protein PW786_03770 [Arachidicoccus sp.]|nr:hypothetical protein [Arachidicoccus sp.]